MTLNISTPKGTIFATYFKSKSVDDGEVTVVMTDKNKRITATIAHGLLGHMNDADGRKIITYLGFNLSRQALAVCGPCSEAKAKQRSPPSDTVMVPKLGTKREILRNVNEKLHIDISSVKSPRVLNVWATKPHWRLIVDERTEMKWSIFYDKKDEMVEPTCYFLMYGSRMGKL